MSENKTPPNQQKAIQLAPETQVKMSLQTLIAILVFVGGAIVWATNIHTDIKNVQKDIEVIKQRLGVADSVSKNKEE